MSNQTSDFLDDTLEDELPEEEAPSPSGQHVKKAGEGSHTRRPARPEREEEAPRREQSRRPAGAAPRKKKRKKKKKSHTGLTVLITVLVTLAVLALAGYLVFMHFFNMMGTGGIKASSTTAATAAPTTASQAVDSQSDATPEPTAEPTPTPEPLTEEELAKLAEMELMASLQEEAEEIMYNENVYNILLLGADGLGDALERTDSMNLLSVNKETGKIWITSLMRDTQVTIPNWGIGHLNWATSIGGVDMLLDTVQSEKNFAIHIDSWAMVNFLDFVKVANLLGPITVSVTAKEAEDMNLLIRQVCQMIDESEGRGVNDWNNIPRYYFPEDQDGTYTITDGAQILGYCRERHVGGDTGRSEKQREVVKQMFENVKNMSLTQQYELAKTILPIITTNMTPGQCFSLLLQLPSVKDYTVHTQQCPTPGAFWKGRDQNGLSIYNADFNVNRNFLRATIYGQRMTAAELTSTWTGERQLVYWDESWN